MYGLAGERRLDEYELDWLQGYEDSRPVRVGNAAAGQLQLDVYGEALDALYEARRLGMPPAQDWGMEDRLNGLARIALGRHPDDGIWEVRGPRRQFVHSKVMAWVAADRTVKLLEDAPSDDLLERMKRLRSDIHDEVCREGFDREHNTFTQYYGSKQLDAGPAAHSQRGLPAALRPTSGGYGRGGPARTTAGRLRDALHTRRGTRPTVCRRERARSCPVASGLSTPWPLSAGMTKPWPSSTACSHCRTTWGSSQRSTINRTSA